MSSINIDEQWKVEAEKPGMIPVVWWETKNSE
jgi:hypothetical protein